MTNMQVLGAEERTPLLFTAVPTAGPVTINSSLVLGGEKMTPPTQLPFMGQGGVPQQCESGLVFCPGISDCFSDVYGDDDAIGWSIEYSGGTVEDCLIYVGVGPGCNLTNAREVGTVSLTSTAVHFCLDRNVYESSAFHLYAGKCPMNDAGAHLRSGDVCNDVDQALYGERWDTYPLKAENVTKTHTHIFDKSAAAQVDYWTNQYNVFDIGGEYRRYLSGHVDVCAVPQGSLVMIDHSSPITPVAQVVAASTGVPAGSPVTLSPTGVPPLASNGAPSIAPASAPTGLLAATIGAIATPRPTFGFLLLPLSPAPMSAPVSTTTPGDVPAQGAVVPTALPTFRFMIPSTAVESMQDPSNATEPLFQQEGSVESPPTMPPIFWVPSSLQVPVPGANPSPTEMPVQNGSGTTAIPVILIDPLPQPSAPTNIYPLGPISASNPAPSPTPAIYYQASDGAITTPGAANATGANETGNDNLETCEPAWVYCPGRSTCLNDPNFNDGHPSTGLGWSIEYDPIVDTYVDNCLILTGIQSCDITTAQQVGTFTLRHDFGHFSFDRYGYTSNDFSLYAGTCRGNDAGNSLLSGTCDTGKVASNAALPHTFPIHKTNGHTTINFTVESSDTINAIYWPTSHKLFPMTTKSYISAYTCVTKNPDFVQPMGQIDDPPVYNWIQGGGMVYAGMTKDDFAV
jgi:hypothetical protein